jgi:DNA polymerase-3 subunit gamma/tau
VDDARDLRERAMYAPSAEGRHKVYIVDEAHMLTREAWNALLKILEEPPPRVIFVFATTEPQKIAQAAAPILSRCQRFDFRRIGVSDIVARLQGVLEKEGVHAPEDALRIVARKADGGMRDALSQLDQVMSLTGGEIDAEAVRRVLGLVEEERYLELLDIVREGRHGDVFDLVDRLVDEGYDLVEFYHGLLDILRVVLRLRLSPDADVDLKEGLRADLVERAAAFEPTDLVRMLASAAELESLGSLRRSPNPRVPIEMLLLRMSYMDRTVSFEELLGALGGGGAPGSPAGSGGSGVGSSRGATPSASAPAPLRRPTPKRTAEAPNEAAAPPDEAPAKPANGHARLSTSAEEAWQDWLEHGRGVPKGLGSFLRAATVADGPGGRVHISGLAAPASERLAEPAVQQAIREGLAGRLGRVPEVVFEAPPATAAKPARVTEAEVRRHAMEALFRQEPRLEKAVEELDLELME